MDFAYDLKTPVLSVRDQLLHEKAVLKVGKFKKAHAELLEVIMEVDQARLYEKFLLTSTFSYCTEILKLTKDITCTLTKIARASQYFPELKEAIDSNEIHMSNARQIAHILNHENKTEWIEKAKVLTQDCLQKEIVKQYPKEAVQEKAKYVADKRIKLEVGLDEETMALLKWAQDFVSQKTRSTANFEAALKEVLVDYKNRHDPVLRAARSENRKSGKTQNPKDQNLNTYKKPRELYHKDYVSDLLPVARRGAEQKEIAPNSISRMMENRESKINNKRTPIPAAIIHQVNLRDKRQCQARISHGNICGSARWIQYHHKIEVQNGGAHTLENLITLCSQHHHLHHNLLE